MIKSTKRRPKYKFFNFIRTNQIKGTPDLYCLKLCTRFSSLLHFQSQANLSYKYHPRRTGGGGRTLEHGWVDGTRRDGSSGGGNRHKSYWATRGVCGTWNQRGGGVDDPSEGPFGEENIGTEKEKSCVKRVVEKDLRKEVRAYNRQWEETSSRTWTDVMSDNVTCDVTC